MDPNDVREKLIRWYDDHHRRLPWRETTDPYAIWVSEVMLQQTQVATAIPYYNRFMARFPSPPDLAAADQQEVLKLWEGLGYYSRARNLHRAAGIVASQYQGRVPDDPVAFRALPGVGDYIAAAVLSIAFGRVMAVVDGNVKRVLARLLEIDTPVNHNAAHKAFRVYADRFVCPRRPSAFNQAMMELGALICRPKQPDCPRCPLADLCRSYRHRTTGNFPTRLAAKKVPHRHQAIAVILKKKTMLVVQRPEDGFLGGLWEFPAVSVAAKKSTPAAVGEQMAAEVGLQVDVLERLTRIRHAYTHFTLSADVYLCRQRAGRVRLRNSPRHRWVTFQALQQLPMHKANHKFIKELEKALASLQEQMNPAAG